MEETIHQVFSNHEEVKTACLISQDFKRWYGINNRFTPGEKITENLYRWYLQAAAIPEFKRVIKMLRKHETQIVNYFRQGATNAK
jgi:transposase